MSLSLKFFQGKFIETLKTKESNKFKLLIYDDMSFPLISQFRVRDLWEQMICDHVHINAHKEELLGIVAIYLVELIEENF